MAISTFEMQCYVADLKIHLPSITLAGDRYTDDLKYAIKTAAAPKLDHMAAPELVLFKVKQSIPLSQPDEALHATIAALFPDGKASESALERLGRVTMSDLFLDPPPTDELHIIVCIPDFAANGYPRAIRGIKRKRDEPSNINLERLNKFAQQAPYYLTDPSTFETIAQDILCCNRPYHFDTIPITLLQEEFGSFKDDCDVLPPSVTSQLLLHSLTVAACNWYNNKSQRRSEIQRVLHKDQTEAGVYLSAEAILDTEYITDGNSTINIMPSVIRACENEYGCALLKAIAYYVQFLMKALNTTIHDRFPCIFLVDIGPYIGFYGCLWTGEHLNVEPLTPLYDLTVHWTDESGRRSIAGALDAFFKAVPRLERHYGEVAILSFMYPERVLLEDGAYPYKTSYEDEKGRQISFKYRSRVGDKLVFTIEPDNQDLGILCVKFTKCYSEDAHRFLAGLGHAPRLRAFMPLAGGWNMVVMDYSRYTPLSDPTLVFSDQLRRDVKAKVLNVLGTLHDEGLVHGDVRDKNILVNRETLESEDKMEVHFIDLDWAGRAERAIRPMRTTVGRPIVVSDGTSVSKEYDITMAMDLLR